MESRRLGHSGLVVSEIGIGCNQFGSKVDAQGTKAIVDKALELGITFFDTGDVYSSGMSETYLGRALVGRRYQALIATKFGSPMGSLPLDRGGSRRYVLHAVDESLRRLGTDYIDLYQYHRPDPLTTFEETLETLNDLVREGKVRYIGTSNMQAWQLADIQWTARSRGFAGPISTEHHYNLLHRDVQNEVIPACRTYNLGLVPYFPLASGLLTGKYRGGTAPEGSRLAQHRTLADQLLTRANYSLVERLESFSKDRGHSILDLALAWLITQPEVSSVIAGVTSPDQVSQNAQASGWRLSPEDFLVVDQILTGA